MVKLKVTVKVEPPYIKDSDNFETTDTSVSKLK